MPQTPPPPSTGAAPATAPGAAVASPNCALLDDPVARGMMSGALETALLHACGRETELAAAVADTAATVLLPQTTTALGNDVLVNDPTGEMTSTTQSGAVVAYNEDNGVLCAAYNDSYHGVVEGTGFTGFSSSNDGGATWSDHGSLNNANSYGYPSLVWRRADGHFYLATLDISGLGLWDLGASCNTDGWVGMIDGGTDDKEMLAVDNNPSSPYYGRLYAVWMDAADWHIYAASSDDGGQSWSAAVDVSGHNQVNGAWPAVDPVTGDVYVAWTHWDVWPDGPIDIEMARSTDGGATWTALTNPMNNRTNPRDATATTNCGRPALNGNIRYYPYPQIAVDHNRVLHVVYSYDPDGYDYGDVVNVYYRRSLNQGVTWENQIRVNDTWTWTDQFFPALAVGETGVIGVFWYDRRLDPANNWTYDRYMALSLDGGVTFEANQRVSDESSPVVSAGPGLVACYHGDYDGAAAGGGYFYTVWGDDRRGNADVWSDSEPYFWGRLYGTIYDATTMRGIAHAHVETIHPTTGMTFSAVSDETGYYEIRVPDNEPYNVTAQAYGYTPNTIAATVDTGKGQTDIPLTPAAHWSITGRVIDANTGYPVYAHVTVTGDPFDPPAPYNETWSDPFTGIYNLPHLAAGIPYTLTFEATGYISRTYFAGELNAHLVNPDLLLQPDLAACTAPGYTMAPPCQPASGAVLQPSLLETEGCPCAEQTHTLYFANHTGAAGEMLLSYATSPGVSVELPASLGVVPNNGVKPFDALVKIDRGVLYSTTVYITITASLASNPAISDTTVIAKRALEPTEWVTRTASPAPSMDGAVIEYGGKLYNVGGYGSNGAVDIYDPATDSWSTGAAEPSPIIDYPIDACFGYVTPTDPVILLLPDATGVVTGTWHRYHIASNTWDTATLPSPLPANGIWSPDIVVDYRANTCYITGGATAAGNGNLTTLYRYNPANNTATLLGNFTHIPTGFDFHAGWYVPWIGTAGGVCVGGGVDSSGNVYADTQCYDIAAATFNPPNADLGLLPEPWWGMADMEKVAANGRQLWLANGVNAAWILIQHSAYFSQELGKFVYGPDPLYSVYRVEGAAVLDKVYVVDGSPAGFAPRTLTEQLLQCPECDCGVAVEKAASADWVYPGEVVTYTVVITAPNWLTGTAELVDTLPASATLIGSVNATYGTAWYSLTEHAVYWTRPTGAYSAAGAGSEMEVFTNTWATNAAGLAYNPETDFARYVHEGSGPEFIHDVDYPVPHPVLHSFSLSDVNPGWSDWRSGIGYDYASGHYFLVDYGGGGGRHDNIVEMDPTGRIINAWETADMSNDSYDGSAITFTVDIAVVPGSPPRYFATALFDGGLVYELDLLKAGQFVTNTWGTVMTCTVPGIADNAGIDYDAQNGVLYHSSWSNETVVVTDLRCNALETFTCVNYGVGSNSGITFIEGQWPPEIWVMDYSGNRTTRCEAVGHEPPPEVITVTYAVEATAPVSTTLVNTATLTCDMPGCAAPLEQSILVLRTTELNGSVQRALDELGYTYDTIYAESDWTGIDFTPYDVVIIGMDGGHVNITSTQKIRTDVIDQGKRAIFIGGTAWGDFVDGVNQYLVANDTATYHWVETASPHFTLTNAAHPLAQGLPASRDFVNSSARWYQLRATDPDIAIIARNGDGHPSYFYKTFAGGGDLVWFIHSAFSTYWNAPADFTLLRRVLANALLRPREYRASAAVHIASRPAITWTKEIYINGNYVGRYNAGPFTVVPTDDVQLVDRLDYVGAEPLFVQLTEDWGSYPVMLTDEYHTRGAFVDGDWSVTLLPGTTERLVKTLHITDKVPVTIQERLYPEGMASEARSVTFQPPVFTKNGPAVAYNGQLITYTLTLNSQDPLLGSLRLTDTLPAGVEYAGGLRASYGNAWYNGGDGAIYWDNTPASSVTQRTLSIPEAETTSQIVPAARSTSGLLAAASPWLALSPSNTWYKAASLPTGRVRYAHAQCPGEPNRFYIISGVPTSATENMWRYDADTDTWTTLARFPAPVEGPSAVCYQGRIYVAGGSGTTQFYIYDIARDAWTEGPSLPRGVWGAAFGAWDGRLFLAGGDNDFLPGSASNQVNIYDIAAGAWNALGATMPISTSAAGWRQVNEYLYLVGGWGDSAPTHNITTTLRYNMADDYWETGPTFTSARSDFVLAATDQYLYAIGGDADGGGYFDAVTLTERLDYTDWYGATWINISDPIPDALSAYNGSFCTTAKSGGEIWSVGGLTAGFVYSNTSHYRPSEPCVTIPPTVTLTFNALVTANPGERVTNTAVLDFHGYVMTATTAFDVPLPHWNKRINAQPWIQGRPVGVEFGDIVTVTDVVETGSPFTLREEWDMARLTLLNYNVTPTVGTVTPYPWVEAPAAPFAYMRFDAEYSEATGHVYFLGGRTGTPTDGRIWEFDPASGVYTDTGVDMPFPVSNYNIARLTDSGGNEVLVTFGGRLNTGSVTNMVQGFYPVSKTTVVFNADPYPVATSPGGVAVVNNIAYVFGGFNNSAVISDTYIFDITAPAGSRWTAGPPLNHARSYIGAAVVDGVIYAIGGDDYPSGLLRPLTITERLDTANPIAWDDAGVADLPVACDEMPAFGFDSASPYRLAGSVVIAGCGQWPGEYATSLRYDVASDTWDETFADLNQARRNHAGAFIPAGAGAGRPGLWVWGGRQTNDFNILDIPEYYDLDAGALRWDAPVGLTQPVTLTKTFEVLPGEWERTVLTETLSIGTWAEVRPVIISTKTGGTIYLPLVLRNH
ncbi:MAG: carboxypeptidase regulatory-like domain-containing protein [Anaerolineae bacterium]